MTTTGPNSVLPGVSSTRMLFIVSEFLELIKTCDGENQEIAAFRRSVVSAKNEMFKLFDEFLKSKMPFIRMMKLEKHVDTCFRPSLFKQFMESNVASVCTFSFGKKTNLDIFAALQAMLEKEECQDLATRAFQAFYEKMYRLMSCEQCF